MRFPRTVRFDVSDTRIYESAAAADEWAVSGAFAFADIDPETVDSKRRQAFVHGFLGTASFGWSTFVTVAEITEAEYEEVVLALAGHAVDCYGAPDIATALPAAREEAAFAAGLCDHKVNTLICVERDVGPDGIVERFRVIEPNREPDHARIWTIVDDDGSV